jgi:hypothetical protein
MQNEELLWSICFGMIKMFGCIMLEFRSEQAVLATKLIGCNLLQFVLHQIL